MKFCSQEQLKQLASDRDTRIAEIDVHSRKKDERSAVLEGELRQKVQGKHQVNASSSTRFS